MKHEDNPRSIKFYVKKYLYDQRKELANKKIIDFPAGNGITSRIIREIGATPFAFDLFPEYFMVDGIDCRRADIDKGIPVEDNNFDMIVCQEGIEHFPDHLHAFRQFNRVLKMNGKLALTTPNYSNLLSRMSYLFTESERFSSTMPPNEVDSIWMSAQQIAPELYFGHIFLTGIQKLRVLAKISGYRISRLVRTRKKSTCLLLFPLLYPPIFFFSTLIYVKNVWKHKGKRDVKEIYREIYKLSVSPQVLLNSHLFVEFTKIHDYTDMPFILKGRNNDFGDT